MTAFGDALRDATLTAESPDGVLRITARGDGRLEVIIDEDKLRYHTETTLAEQAEAAITRLLRANRRAYVEAWRTASDYPDNDLDP
jgi:hypothetical protein